MGWLGAQTMIGQYMYGKTVYAGRLSFIIRIGQFAAGPMAGVTWDLFGPWGGFALMALWGCGSIACSLLLPPQPQSAAVAPGNGGRRAKVRALLPNASDYLTAFRLLGVPAVLDHRAARRADACRQRGAGLVLCGLAQRHGADRHRHRAPWPRGRDRGGAVLARDGTAASLHRRLVDRADLAMGRRHPGVHHAAAGQLYSPADRDVPALGRQRTRAAAGDHAGAARRRRREPGQGDRTARHGQPHRLDSLPAGDGRHRRGGGTRIRVLRGRARWSAW